MENPLSIPDHPAWRSEQLYSELVAHALLRAFNTIAVSPQDALRFAYARATEVLRPCLAKPMSLRQRMLVAYILGLAAMTTNTYRDAIAHFDVALELAIHRYDVQAGIELSHLNTQMYWDLVELPVAADYAHLTLELLRVAGGDETACVLADADLTIDIFARAALIDWFRGDYSNCVLHTDLAQRTLAATSPPPASAAAFKWLQALSLQLSGHLESALSQALAAASLYEGHHSAGSRVRIATVVADIALDLAERYVERDAGFVDTTGHAYLARATPFVENALTLARQTDDDSGEVLALLATARLARIKHDNVDRLTLLESAQWTAERLCDVALVGQTRTALGAELSSQGRSESALNCYREAMDVFAAKGIDGLGWRARRALLVHQEMTPA